MLIEPIDDERVKVTFVWPRPDRQVSVRAQVFDDPNALSHPMERVGDTWRKEAVVRADAVFTYQFIVDDPFLDADTTDLNELARLMAETPAFADPANPRRIFPQTAVIAGRTEVDEQHWDSVAIMPKAEPMDWFDGPAPELDEHFLVDRTITVYRTPTDDETPLVVLLDGECWPRVANLHAAIDALVRGGELPPVTVAFVHNLGGPADRMREQACSADFADLLADEVVPLLRKHYALNDDVTIGGDSLAGLAATHAAFTRPDTFRNVISTAGCHWWGLLIDGEPEWLTRQIATAPKKPLRFWVDVGALETGVTPYAPGVDQRAASRHLRTVLRAKGYDVAYHEAPGGHDFATFRRSTTKGLLHLLGAK